jgi:hypothetical protein
VYGSDFNASSVVQFNGAGRTTTLVNSGELSAVIPSTDIASAGTYTITVFNPGVPASDGIILNMNTSSVANVAICQGNSYVLPDGISQSTTGTYLSTIPNAAGCDSIITTNLTVISNNSSSVSASVCQGSSFILPDGTSQNTAGVYVSHILSVFGCDSVITTTLTVIPNTTSSTNVSICQGGYYTLPDGTMESNPGVFITHIPNANGCDSAVTTTISVIANSSSSASASICDGLTYILPDGSSQNTSGVYVSHISNAAGCDSAITTTLNVIPNTSSSMHVSICQGSSHILPNGVTVNTAGNYVTVIPNSQGCDSTISTTLTIISNTTNLVNASI